MQINITEPMAQYIKKGRLATFRTYRYLAGKHVRIKIKGEYDSIALIKEVLYMPEPSTIKNYVKDSGFKSVDDWMNAINSMYDTKAIPTKWLVVIERQDK